MEEKTIGTKIVLDAYDWRAHIGLTPTQEDDTMKDLALNYLALAANCERMANFTYFTEQTRDMHRKAAQQYRNRAAQALRATKGN